MIILVTGSNGFSGTHFCRRFVSVGLNNGTATIDLRDAKRLRERIATVRPDAVVHLAAQSSVKMSVQDPVESMKINFSGTLNLLQALDANNFNGVLLYVGSGEIYGNVDINDLPIQEKQELRPRTPYAVSKVAAEALCYQWSQTGKYRVIMARPFNHIGAGQKAIFAVSDFARQINEMILGRRLPVLMTGDLDVVRDFSDVRDVVRAYYLLLQKGVNGEVYNICSGRGRSLRSIVEGLLQIAEVQADLHTNIARLRPTEQKVLIGNPSAIYAAVGWRNEIILEDTLLSIMNFWKNELDI